MLFNSLAFAVFLPVVFALYWAIRRRPLVWQNALLLAASYLFYGWWDYRFLSLLLISSTVDYLVGLRLEAARTDRHRRLLLLASLLVNLGILGFFKYFGFFVDSFADLLRLAGLEPHPATLRILLPVGISFYTFQTLSYTIDIYRRRMTATHDPVAFFAYVAFFPQLVAGPIERARRLLPQFTERRRFDPETATDGLRQMLWGLAKKVVVADNLAPHIERAFTGYAGLDGLALVFGAFLFAMQIYCDFSGYSDIAIGTARLFGFRLMRNFAFPYFSRDIAEFWRRWHISLSTWFRDYLYIPLGGSRTSTGVRIRNVLITFVVSGFWHGANWTFIAWGLLHGLYYVPLMLAGRQRDHLDVVAPGRLLPGAADGLRIALTFCLVLVGWVFFRAENVTAAVGYLARIVQQPLAEGAGLAGRPYLWTLAYVVPLLGAEWLQRSRQHALEIGELRRGARWAVYLAVGLAILTFGNFGEVEFIYFQF